MTQVDLETLVGGGGDGKVSCETLIAAVAAGSDPDPNLPPESIQISIEDSAAIVDYLDLTAVYDRDDSTKESTNPKSQNHNSNPNPNHSRSNSQRYSVAAATGTNLKANGPIIGLPNKIKHVTCTVTRRHFTNAPIFPKNKKPAVKSGNDKSAVPEFEPSSPKVSCFGKVLSDRERDKCRLAHRRPSPDQSGCWAGISKLFSCGGGGRWKKPEPKEAVADVAATGNNPLKRRSIPSGDDVAAPGLGGMKRFASGRRAASWGSDVEVDGHVAVDLSRQLVDDDDDEKRGGVWGPVD